MELVLDLRAWMDSGQAGSADLSIIKAMRVVRILRLVRVFRAPRRYNEGLNTKFTGRGPLK